MTNTPDLLRLIATVFIAVTCVVIGDTAGKLLTGGGVDPFIVAWSRFLLAALMLLPFSGLTRQELPALLDWRVLLRAGFIVCGICCILTALKTEPIANVFGAFFVGPVVSYVLAILFLGERPSAQRSLLLGLGFAGVMLVVKPGFGSSAGMAFALAAGTFYGAYLVMTRTLAGAFRPRFLLISQLLIGAVVLTPFGLQSDFPVPDMLLLALLLVSAVGSALGNFLLVMASRKAEASLIAPLVYSQLISATALGIVVFGDWPDLVSLAGLVLIAISGLGSLLVHQRAGRGRLSTPPYPRTP
ncbi:DMT family transporter [Paracoccus methylovorus]|jgi:drug/metabolite transporter (DMT)-like permease|uniref:EamA domain-containing protein n=2 Tax=Paracoccus TaxID=265 RepID=A1B6K5_PARDP|nr:MULTISPECIES: DMT family transporter [Paracoccus]ABL71149.1 protein of unknown function DUF6, transmembrane [Paracoccus denitrificans PD1222]MBB4628246.1 drug/metabolite transporter (DMT)-like permease [Paracoccus denitrificans]MCU7429309.1 DMT family transporter [Paracoccus denitrificans]MDK8873297.1 DMT family transporter [Paracoccus sp. SSJ]QAR27800.1 DMT family transporter [Paracoccus denitrificans]